MWNAIQGAAGDFANRASKLAVEVLDAGPPDELRSHGQQSPIRDATEPPGVLRNDRLSALKARYKAPLGDSASPHIQEEHEGGSAGSTAVGNALEENSEIIRLRDQLERLKRELMHQTTAAEETLRQQRYEWNEQMKQRDAQHRNEIQHSRDEITSYFQSLLEAKEQELASVQTAQNQSGGALNTGDDKDQEIENLRQHVVELQQREINEAFGIDQSHSESDTAQFQQLQQEYEGLKLSYQQLVASSAEMVSSEQMAERDARWREEIESREVAHKRALEAAQQLGSQQEDSIEQLSAVHVELEALQQQWVQTRSENETLHREKQKLAEEATRLQQSLEERDAIWQQELISSQKEQQELRKQYEAIKREYAEEQERHGVIQAAHGELEAELQSEYELRNAAQAHVRSLQKSMMDLDSGASSVKQELLEAQKQKEQIQQSYEQRLQNETVQWKTQLSQLEHQNQSLQESIQSMTQRLEEAEGEREDLQRELEKYRGQESTEGGAIDVAKLTYDLESSVENLKLAESRNSILRHEVESLTQELEQLKITPQPPNAAIVTEESNSGRLKSVEAERDGYREQLKRLKKQMIQMQEDQEASLHWRIDAEVKLALEDFKKRYHSEGGSLRSELSQLQHELESVQEELKLTRSQMEQKDAELINLQIALGELTYHGEAADKLRRDLRDAQEQIQSLQDEILDANATVAEATCARKAAEASADEAHKLISEQQDKLQHLENHLFSVKKELLDATQKLRNLGNDDGAMVDRRLVVQLLVAYLEKKHEKDALEVMARMLGFTEEERHRVGVSSAGRGLFGSVAGGTLALVKGSMSVATLGLLDRGLNSQAGSQLADDWVEFLTKENPSTEQEDPLSYLQKGAQKYPPSSLGDRESARMTPSEASLPTGRRYEVESKRSHQHSSSISSRSEGTATSPPPVSVLTHAAVHEARLPPRLPQPVGRTPMPSFRDFMERQREPHSG